MSARIISTKLFKEETGQTFVEYLTSIRMEKAKTLLNTTDKSMKEICTAVDTPTPITSAVPSRKTPGRHLQSTGGNDGHENR